MENIERRKIMERVEEQVDQNWLEIPELDPKRKFYFPQITSQPRELYKDSLVEFMISPNGQKTKISFKKYLKYLGLDWNHVKKIWVREVGTYDKLTPEMAAEFLKTLPQLWKNRLIERKKIAEKIRKEIEQKSGEKIEEQKNLQEATEKAFAKLLNESGYFEQAEAAEWVNDVLDGCDVVVKLEDDGYLAIQHTVLADSERIEKKRNKVIEKGKISLPEHLEYGPMPLVFIKDDIRKYMIEAETEIEGQEKKRVPWINYYKEKLQANPDAMLWKFFKNDINQMINDWLRQIISCLVEEANIYDNNRNFYLDYLEKIKKIAVEHEKYLKNLCLN